MKLVGIVFVLLIAGAVAVVVGDGGGRGETKPTRESNKPERPDVQEPKSKPAKVTDPLPERRGIPEIAAPRSSQKVPESTLPKEFHGMVDLGRMTEKEMANFMGYVQSIARSRKQELQEFEKSVDREDPDQLVKLRELQHMKAVGDAMAKAMERGDYFLSETSLFQVKDCDVISTGMMRDGKHLGVTVFVRRSVFHDVRDAYERRQNAQEFVDLETVRIFNLKGHAERKSILARLRRTTKHRSPGDGRLIRKYYRERIAIDWDNALLRTR